MKRQKVSVNKFPGFPRERVRGNFWSYPTVMDRYWNLLNGSEQKVLDFFLRHTLGFDKVRDQVSYSQFTDGNDGISNGTGLSRPTVIRAVRSLIKKGFIRECGRGNKANTYELVINFNYPGKGVLSLASNNNLHTIDNDTIDNKQYVSSKKKRYYNGNPMRHTAEGWFVICDGEWLEFAGKDEDTVWE